MFDILTLPKEIVAMIYEYYNFTPITEEIVVNFRHVISKIPYMSGVSQVSEVVNDSNKRIEAMVEYICHNRDMIMTQWNNNRNLVCEDLLTKFAEKEYGLYSEIFPELFDSIVGNRLEYVMCVNTEIDTEFFNKIIIYACTGRRTWVS